MVRKLTDLQVMEIKQQLALPDCYRTDLAKKYGVSKVTITKIGQELTYAKIIGEDPATLIFKLREDYNKAFSNMEARITRMQAKLDEFKSMEDAIVQVMNRVTQHSQQIATITKRNE